MSCLRVLAFATAALFCLLPASVAAAAPAAESEPYLRVVAQRVVLSYDAPEIWELGAPRLLESGEQVVVVKDAAENRLQAELLRWRGQRLRLFDARGARCEVTVHGLQIVGRVVPHFSTRESWKEAAASQVAQEAWDLSAGGRALAAEVTGFAAACGGAQWARLASDPVPSVAPAEAVNPALRQVALTAFHKLAEYRKLQSEYAAWFAKAKPRNKRVRFWENYDAGEAKVWVMRWQQGERRASLLAVQARALGCGGFSGSLWALWELPAATGSAPVLRKAGTEPDGLRPKAAADLDGDGRPDVIFDYFMGEGLLRGDQLQLHPIPYLDCPC